MGCEKRATTWRTFLIVPCGEKVTVAGGESARAQADAPVRQINKIRRMRAIETKSGRLAARALSALAENWILAEVRALLEIRKLVEIGLIAVPLPTSARDICVTTDRAEPQLSRDDTGAPPLEQSQKSTCRRRDKRCHGRDESSFAKRARLRYC